MSVDDEDDEEAQAKADVAAANEKLSRLTAEPPLPRDSEFDACRSVIASIRAALDAAEAAHRQARLAWQARVHSLEMELRMMDIANKRLRDAKKAKK